MRTSPAEREEGRDVEEGRASGGAGAPSQTAIVTRNPLPLTDDSTLPKVVGEIFKNAGPFTLSYISIAVAEFGGAVILAKDSHEALAASGLITATQQLLKGSVGALVFATGLYSGRSVGAQRYVRVGRIYRSSTLISLLSSLPIGTAVFFSEAIFRDLLGQSPEVASLVQDYFRAYAVGLPAVYALMSNNQMALGVGKPWVSFWTTFLQKASMLGLGYGLVLGKGGLPKLGVTGLGVANTATIWATYLACLAYFKLSSDFKKYDLFSSQRAGRALGFIKRIVKKGAPIGVQVSSEFLTLTIVSTMMGWISSDSLAASEIVNQAGYLALLPTSSLSQTAGVMVGKYLKAGMNVVAMRIGNSGMTISLVVPAALLAASVLTPDTLINLFYDTSDSSHREIISVAQQLMWVNAIGQVLNAARYAASGGLRGFLDIKTSMWVSILSIGVVGVPLCYLMAFTLDMGGLGLYVAMDAATGLGAIILTSRWGIFARSPENHMRIEEVEEGSDDEADTGLIAGSSAGAAQQQEQQQVEEGSINQTGSDDSGWLGGVMTMFGGSRRALPAGDGAVAPRSWCSRCTIL